MPHRVRVVLMNRRAVGATWWMAALLASSVAAVGASIAWRAVELERPAADAPASTPAEALQQQLLRDDLGLPSDPILSVRYDDVNTRYFAGALPRIPVVWEPRLAEVGQLAAGAYTLEGMFGHVGRRAVILLNTDLQTDDGALARALCHEIVHAALYARGESSTGHGAAFQTILQRLAREGAFDGIVATSDERAALRTWIDAESARLQGERADVERAGAGIDRDREAIQREGEAASDEERAAYNARVTDINGRLARDRADLKHLNDEIARYKLMLAYPDGLDEDQGSN